jgi:hypothetical protein
MQLLLAQLLPVINASLLVTEKCNAVVCKVTGMGFDDQLDLFMDSHVAPMNPNKSKYTPDCFVSHLQYQQWLHEAYRAKEQTFICEDCTNEYKAKMKAQGRCHEEWTRDNGIVYSRRKEKELTDEIITVLAVTKVRSSYKSSGSRADKGSGSPAYGFDLSMSVRAWTAGQGRDRQSDWVGSESDITQTTGDAEAGRG